jgi:hypothetical protein
MMLRLLTEQDQQNRHAYPLQTFQAKMRRKKCSICDIYPARYAEVAVVVVVVVLQVADDCTLHHDQICDHLG